MILIKIIAQIIKVFNSKEKAAFFLYQFNQYNDAAKLYLEEKNFMMAKYAYQRLGNYFLAGQVCREELKVIIKSNRESHGYTTSEACENFIKANAINDVIDVLIFHFKNKGGIPSGFDENILPALVNNGHIDQFAHAYSLIQFSDANTSVAEGLKDIGRPDLALLILKSFFSKEKDKDTKSYIVSCICDLNLPEAIDFVSNLLLNSHEINILTTSLFELKKRGFSISVQPIISFIEKPPMLNELEEGNKLYFLYEVAFTFLGESGVSEAEVYLKEISKRGKSWPNNYFSYEINDALTKIRAEK
ncbi:MAG: hypothetical protein DWQ05_21885 [Calditrichaeota bacterium]|nr:MAG: hypothetical protein DWQ05_21885 [Calditrichota bacterium]